MAALNERNNVVWGRERGDRANTELSLRRCKLFLILSVFGCRRAAMLGQHLRAVAVNAPRWKHLLGPSCSYHALRGRLNGGSVVSALCPAYRKFDPNNHEHRRSYKSRDGFGQRQKYVHGFTLSFHAFLTFFILGAIYPGWE